MNWRAGALMGLAAFLVVCGWWLVKAAALHRRVGDLRGVWTHAEMADPATILARALLALVAGLLAGAYLGGRARSLLQEALEERQAFALLRSDSAEDGQDDAEQVDAAGAIAADENL